MTGLYSETNDDSSADLDLPQTVDDTETAPNTTNYDSGKTAQSVSVTVSTTLTNPAITTTYVTSDTVIKCHSRQPSAIIVDREKTDDLVDDELLKDCGILSCRPAKMQKLARIKVCLLKSSFQRNV